MYNKLNITENHLQVLALFTKGYNKEYYIREVQKLLKISPRTAQLILNDLEKKGIVTSKIRGKIKTFKLNKNKTAEDYMILVEQYKKMTFLEKHAVIREIISKTESEINGVGAIFGSYAKGLNKEGSDLDILIVGACKKSKIKDISERYGIEINIKNYPIKVFKEELRKDILLKEVLDNHIVFKNVEEFVKEVLNNG